MKNLIILSFALFSLFSCKKESNSNNAPVSDSTASNPVVMPSYQSIQSNQAITFTKSDTLSATNTPDFIFVVSPVNGIDNSVVTIYFTTNENTNFGVATLGNLNVNFITSRLLSKNNHYIISFHYHSSTSTQINYVDVSIFSIG